MVSPDHNLQADIAESDVGGSTLSFTEERIGIGGIDPAILCHTIEIAFGRYREDKNWQNKRAPVGALFAPGAVLAAHTVGDKDGPCITQGELVSGQRLARNVKKNYVQMFDHDNGEPLDVIEAKIRASGLAAVLWTTYNHMQTSTMIAEAALHKWIKSSGHKSGHGVDGTVDQAIDFLKETKKVNAAIFAAECKLTKEFVEGGVKYRLTHAPMPRVRSMFVLAEAFDFANRGSSQTAAIQEWKEKMAGHAAALDLAWDRSCVDPSRLMYLPRRAPDSNPAIHEIRQINGKLLDLNTVPRLEVEKRGPVKKHLQADAYVTELKSEMPVAAEDKAAFKTPGMLSFLREDAEDFEAARWLQEKDPDNVRAEHSDKIEHRCPFEDNHSEQKADDRAFMVVNASDSEHGFHMGCLHNGCIEATGKDRAKYLDALCAILGVENARELHEWCPAAQKEAERDAADEDTLAHLINSLTPGSTPDEIDVVIERIAESKKTQAARDALLRSAAEKVDGKWTARVESKWRRYVKDANQRRQDDSPSQFSLANPIGIYLHFHYKDQLAKTKALFAERNAIPYIFTREEGGQFRTFSHNGKVKSEEMTGSRSAWHDELNAVADFRRITDKLGDQGVAPFPDIITAFVGTTQLDLPVLDQIVYFPIFDQSGKLRTEQGYDPGTRCYLDPKFTPTLDGRPVPTHPTDEDVATALGWIREAVFDMPFTDCFGEANTEPQYSIDENGVRAPNPGRGAASFEHFITIGLEMIMRNMIKGPCPAKHIAKPEVGTGGSLMVKVLHNIFTGEDPSDIPLSSSPEELRKLITSLLRCAGSNLLFFDNIASDHLNMPFMAQLLTAGIWQDRILSKSEVATIPFTKQIVFCGNRLTFTKEMIRRNVPVGLNTYLSNPASDRDSGSYRHYPLIDWVLEQRANLAGAFYTLAFRGIEQGVLTGGVKPVRTLASFDGWSQIVGGTLAACGMTAFLGNLESYRDDVSSDEEENVYADIVQTIWERKGHEGFNRDVVEMADPLGVVFKKDSTAKSRETSSGKQIGRSLIDKTFIVTGPPGKRVTSSDPDSTLRTAVVFACVREKRPKEFMLKKIR